MDDNAARSPLARLRLGVARAVGVGAVVGALDAALGLGGAPPLLSASQAAVVVGASVVVHAALAAVVGLVAGPIHVGGAPEDRFGPSVHLGVVAAVGVLVVVGPIAAALDADGSRLGALVVGMLAPLAGVLVYGQARWLLGRAAAGGRAVTGWGLAAAGMAGILGVVAVWLALRSPAPTGGGSGALVVTVDGLRRDDVKALPRVKARAARAVSFADAVAPGGGQASGDATALTGLHPLRHGAVRDGVRVQRGTATLAERLSAAGWGTAAFVSSVAVAAEVGLSAGFAVYDDGFGRPPGLDRTSLAGALLSAGGPVRRPAAETVAAALAHSRPGGPWFVWVHLADGLPGATPRAEALAELDVALDRLLAAFDGAVVVLAGSGGVLLGEHDRGPLSDEPWEARVRVPLWLWAPGVAPATVEAQVRLLDVASSVAARVGLPGEVGEGVDLALWWGPAGGQGLAATLVGHDRDGGRQLGLRASGAKVWIDLESGSERLYDLAADPGETRDVYAEQPFVMEVAKRVLATEAVASRELGEGVAVGRTLATRLERLRAEVSAGR